MHVHTPTLLAIAATLLAACHVSAAPQGGSWSTLPVPSVFSVAAPPMLPTSSTLPVGPQSEGWFEPAIGVPAAKAPVEPETHVHRIEMPGPPRERTVTEVVAKQQRVSWKAANHVRQVEQKWQHKIKTNRGRVSVTRPLMQPRPGF